MKKNLILLATVIIFIAASAQTSTIPDLNKGLIPPTPDAASLGKFGIIPVTLYEGMPNTSVPIFELKSAKLTVPVSLNYNYNGYRPGEEASWAGLGWTLQAGGAITRVVKGMVDDGINTTYPWSQYANLIDLAANQNYMATVGLHIVDTEPDIYIFNFNGHSGKFILVGSRAYVFPQQDIRIVQSGTGFLITAEDGTKYSFLDNEVTTPNNSTNPGIYTPQYNSAWFLSKIISADNTDTVAFSYSGWSHRQYASSYTETYQVQTGGFKNGNACLGGSSNCDVWSVSAFPGAMMGAKRLTKINCRSGYINFVPEDSVRKDYGDSTNAFALKEIDIYSKPDSSLLKKVSLQHGYFDNNSQLKLSSVAISGYHVNHLISDSLTADSLVIPNYYSFQYANEGTGSFPKSTKGIDTWGYYNGQSNYSLFDASIEPYTLAMTPGDRTVHADQSMNGMLTKITYPSGGYTTFEYEANKIGTGGSHQQIQNLQTSSSSTYDGTHDPTIAGTTFLINQAQTIHFTWQRDISSYPNGVLNTYQILKIYLTHSDTALPTLIYTSPRLNKALSSGSDQLTLDTLGLYSFTVSCESTSASSSATINYYTLLNIPYTGDPGPGLRVSAIKSYDNLNSSTPAITKVYTYAPGIIISGGAYGYQEVVHNYISPGCGSGGNYTESIFTSDYSSPLSSLLNNQFYYPQVTEINHDAAGTGKTVYYFAGGGDDALDVYMTAQYDSSYSGGTYKPVKASIHTDTVLNPINFWAFTWHLGTVSDPAGGCFLLQLVSPDQLDTVPRSQLYAAEPYAMSVLYRREQSTDEISYDQNGTNPLTVHTDFYYDNPDYMMPSRTTVQNSKGQTVTTQVKFPMDYPLTSCTTPYVTDTSFKHKRDSMLLSYQSCTSSRYSAALPYWNPSIDNSTNTALKAALASYPCETTYASSYSSLISSMNTAVSGYPGCVVGTAGIGFSDAQDAIIMMQGYNIKASPIEQIVSINKSGTDYLFAANKTDFTMRGTSSLVLPQTLYQTPFTSTSTLKSSFLGNPSSYYQSRVNFKYDILDNIIEQSKTNDIKMTYLWDYKSMYPIAQVSNADTGHIAYTSFESDGTGNWSFSPSGITTTNKGITGGKSYTLSSGSISKSGLDNTKTYIISYWLKSGGSASVSNANTPASGLSKNGWTYYETTTTSGATSVSISGSSSIDEVRLFPSDAQMTTYTYDPLIGITSTTSPNNIINYYQYDPLGRLKDIRDVDGNVLKLYDYKYQTVYPTYLNSAASSNFTRNNCTGGQVGTTVTYTVPAATYASHTSQANADSMALNDVSANGQSYANTNGSCVSTVTITCQNLIAVSGFTAVYTNTSTSQQYTFTITSASGTQTLGTVPIGTYNLVISKTGNSTSYIFSIHNNTCGTYTSHTGTSATFSSISANASSCNDITIDSVD